MPKKLIFTILIASLVLAGCNLFPVAPTAAPVATNVPPAETQTPIIIIVTATPESQQEVPTDTPVAAVTSTPSPSDSINITKAEDLGGGKANITWEVNGNFPAGFEVVWSETNSSPSFPGDSSTYLSDSATRAVQIVGQTGHTYYLRICRYVNNSCDLYSNVAQINFSGAPATPIVFYPTSIYPTATSMPWLPAYDADGNLITADAGMKINKVVKTASGKATLYFQAAGISQRNEVDLHNRRSTADLWNVCRYFCALQQPNCGSKGRCWEDLLLPPVPIHRYYLRCLFAGI